MTDDPSGRLIALRDHLERIARDYRREAALWPKTARAQQVARMLESHATDLDGLITALLRPQREEQTEDTVSRVDGKCDVPPTGSTA